MDFVNATPLAARLDVARPEGHPARVAIVTAKATFCYDAHGQVTPDREDPFPLFDADEETPLGLLPRDNLPRMDEAFEVILLGEAMAPAREPVTAMKVALAVGNERRELVVVGDRCWASRKVPMPNPEPFVRMPLTRDRAFGGSVEVLVDVESPVDISHPRNPFGRGFDPGPSAEQLGRYLKCPGGYPQWPRDRWLPNLEDPAQRIERWDDDPVPASWATVPYECFQQVERAMDVPNLPPDALARPEMPPPAADARLYHRAHPTWVIGTPPDGAHVTYEGLADLGRVTFALPRIRVWADWLAGHDGGAFELRPQLFVLLPSETRFYLVYRWASWIPHRPHDERCVRLRIEDGWFSPKGEA